MRTLRDPLESSINLIDIRFEVGILCICGISASNPDAIDMRQESRVKSQNIAQSSLDPISGDGIPHAFTDRKSVSDGELRRGQEDEEEELSAETTSFRLNTAELSMFSQANSLTPAVEAARGMNHSRNP